MNYIINFGKARFKLLYEMRNKITTWTDLHSINILMKLNREFITRCLKIEKKKEKSFFFFYLKV